MTDGKEQTLGKRKRMVWPYDGPARFLVKSATDPHGVHLVDLLAYHGNGECTCEDFTYRQRTKAKEIQDPGSASDQTRCFHLRVARAFLLDQVVEQLQRMEAGQ